MVFEAIWNKRWLSGSLKDSGPIQLDRRLHRRNRSQHLEFCTFLEHLLQYPPSICQDNTRYLYTGAWWWVHAQSNHTEPICEVQNVWKTPVSFYVLCSQSAPCDGHVPSGTYRHLTTPLALFIFVLLFTWPDIFNRPKSSPFLLKKLLGRE